MATLKVLQAKIAKLQAQAEAIAKRESSAVIGKIRDMMEQHGLTADDIAAHFRQSKPGRKSGAVKKSANQAGAAKYLNPKTGATWTGRGRAPQWIANVKDRSKFLAEESSIPAAGASKEAKPGNYVRGPQAHKYRDPSSGSTWSGRGPAPAWLAAAKDRSAFLIANSGAANTSAQTASSKKTAVKKASKKAATSKPASKKSATGKAASAKKAAPSARKTPARTGNGKRAVASKSATRQATENVATGAGGSSEASAA